MPVRILVPKAVADLRGRRDSHDGQALVDTGASGTCISPRAFQALGLKAIAHVRSGGLSGPDTRQMAVVDIEFLGSGITVHNLPVVEADITDQGLDMLVGRDVLSVAAFTYDGPAGKWMLELPIPDLIHYSLHSYLLRLRHSNRSFRLLDLSVNMNSWHP